MTTTYNAFCVYLGLCRQTLGSVLMPLKPAVSLQSNRNSIISFFLSNSQPVSVKLYNASGAEIASLVNENLGSGLHSIDLSNRNISAGCYAVRIHTGASSFVRSISIVR